MRRNKNQAKAPLEEEKLRENVYLSGSKLACLQARLKEILIKQKVMFTNMDYTLSVRKQDARMYMTVGQEGQRHL